MRRIAIVEDEPAIRANYADALRRHGYDVTAYANGKDALAAFRTRLPDLALVDIGLGDDMDGGFALTRELRALSATVPIIFLSARDSDFDIVAGLRLGADDYLTKDASLPHLAARIAALFRRSELLSAPPATEDIVERGPLTLDVKRLTAHWNGQRVDLTLTEFWMVHALARHPGTRQGPRRADARRQHRRRRQHDHVAREADPAQVPGARPGVRPHRHRIRHGLPLGRMSSLLVSSCSKTSSPRRRGPSVVPSKATGFPPARE